MNPLHCSRLSRASPVDGGCPANSLRVERWFRLEPDGNAFARPEFQKNRFKKNYHVIDGKRNGVSERPSRVRICTGSLEAEVTVAGDAAELFYYKSAVLRRPRSSRADPIRIARQRVGPRPRLGAREASMQRFPWPTATLVRTPASTDRRPTLPRAEWQSLFRARGSRLTRFPRPDPPALDPCEPPFFVRPTHAPPAPCECQFRVCSARWCRPARYKRRWSPARV